MVSPTALIAMSSSAALFFRAVGSRGLSRNQAERTAFRLLRSVAGHGTAILLLLSTVACGNGDSTRPASPESTVDSRTLSDLFRSVRSGAFSAEIQPFLSEQRKVPQNDPGWPTFTYLLGEAHLKRGDADRARAKFRELASWAASNHPAGPYNDTWGGSGLAVVGLWRWLQVLEKHGAKTPDEIGNVIAVASDLDETRLYAGMLRSAFLPALPLVEEDIARLLAHVAWNNRRPEAATLFLNFLAIDSSGTPDQIGLEIQQELVKKGLASPQRLELFRARRLLGLAKTEAQKNQAADRLKALWEHPDAAADIRAEAGYEWANYRRAQKDRKELVRVLDGVLGLAGEGTILEQALYRRATVHNRGNAAEDFEAFRADMHELLRRYPKSGLADDALFQLATEYLFKTEVDTAVSYYAQLRSFQGPNDYKDSAYFLAALGHVGRANQSDLDAADRLFDEYVRRYPDGPFRLRCLFWRGRIAEQRAGTEQARAWFQQIVDEAPYDYYGIRARMHLEEGVAARSRDLPGADSATRRELRQAYRASQVETKISGTSVYHSRLRAAVASGLYRQVLVINQGMDSRLDDVSLGRLHEHGLVPAAALLLSLRQDALAARDAELTADNWLRLAGALGVEAEDWPVAAEMTTVRGNAPRARIGELQRDARYLATVYPNPRTLRIVEPLAHAAWPIEGSRGLSQGLMYSVIRQESRFYPRAISQAGALGLFQFMPAVFDALDRRWRLLAQSNAPSGVEYLFDPDRNTRLWARWVNDEFPVESRSGIAMALMKHQAGSANVRRWGDYWQKLGDEADLEYRVETARFNVTRNFVRGVLRDTAIVDAGGLFED